MVERIRVISTSCTALRIEVVVSNRMPRSMLTGSADLELRQLAQDAVHHLDDIGAGLLGDLTRMAGLPLKVPRLRTFSTPSETSATS